MSRYKIYSALILRVRSQGESNREAQFLSAEEGIVTARLYGGPKSKLRAHISPFHSGTIYLYHDPVRDSNKISDFDVRTWRPALREVYERSRAAFAVCETILASAGSGGNWPEALDLAEAVLDAINTSGAAYTRRLLLYFFWHWLNCLGARPDLSRCAECGSELDGAHSAWYAPKENGLLCRPCMDSYFFGPDTLLKTGAGCRHYLSRLQTLRAADMERYGCDIETENEAALLCTALLTQQLGRPLAAW
jgi:DNA repair protein RecO (recombination protein O)